MAYITIQRYVENFDKLMLEWLRIEKHRARLNFLWGFRMGSSDFRVFSGVSNKKEIPDFHQFIFAQLYEKISPTSKVSIRFSDLKTDYLKQIRDIEKTYYMCISTNHLPNSDSCRVFEDMCKAAYDVHAFFTSSIYLKKDIAEIVNLASLIRTRIVNKKHSDLPKVKLCSILKDGIGRDFIKYWEHNGHRKTLSNLWSLEERLSQ